MLCDICGKNEATMHFTKIINGNTETKHICEECFDKDIEFDKEYPFSMHKLFANFIDELQGDSMESEDLKCENCGLLYEEFKQHGKFGCPLCYDAFEDKIDPLLKGIQGDIFHRGKVPSKNEKELKRAQEIRDLELRLTKAVETENYEQAAVYRDKIKALNTEDDVND